MINDLDSSPKNEKTLGFHKNNLKDSLELFREKLSLKLLIEKDFDFFSVRNQSLDKLYREIFKSAAQDYKLNYKHILNLPYPVTFEAFMGSVENLNKEYSDVSLKKYHISVDAKVRHKIKGFISDLQQDLPLEINTPIKYLVSPPHFMGKTGDIILLSAQIEGGYNFYYGNEITCSSILISLKKTENRKYTQVSMFKPEPNFAFTTKLEKVDTRMCCGDVSCVSSGGSSVNYKIAIHVDEDGKLSHEKL